MSRDTLPKINMNRDMLQSVNKDGYPFVGATTEADQAWEPRPPTPEEIKDPGRKWDNVVAAWTADKGDSGSGGTPAVSRAEKVVNAWAARLRFADKAISGTRPGALIKRFNDMVPAAPMIALGVA